MVKKAPERQATASGKIVDTCKGCSKYGLIWSGSGDSERCKTCAVETKATDAGIDAMRGD